VGSPSGRLRQEEFDCLPSYERPEFQCLKSIEHLLEIKGRREPIDNKSEEAWLQEADKIEAKWRKKGLTPPSAADLAELINY